MQKFSFTILKQHHHYSITNFFQAEANSAALKNGPRHSLNSNTEEKKPMIGGRKRNTDRTTRLLIVILVLFLIAEFPIVRRLE